MMWGKIREKLQVTLPQGMYGLWIEPLQCIRSNEEGIDLVGPDRFFCSWFSDKYLPYIKEYLTMLGHADMPVTISVAREKDNQKMLPDSPTGSGQLRLPEIPQVRSYVRTLHPRYTFDEFMIGECNALSHTACHALANDDIALGRFIYIDAGTGLGKSHLTHAVAHHVLGHSPNTRLHYLTVQQLTAEMVRNIKNNTMEHFKDRYYNQCDMLLMEDIHTLSGRTKTQLELSAALDVLVESGKRIIFTGALPPKDIQDIDPGLRSRLSSGLIARINPPDLNTRYKIIDRKAKNSELYLSEEIVDYLSSNIKGDIRQLESAIVGLKAKSCLLKSPPDLGMAKEVVASIIGRTQHLTVETIRGFVAEQFKASVGDMQSKSRKKSVAFPRQVAMYLARKLTDNALADIGKAFNRDHSTVVHSIRVVSETMVRNSSVRGQIDFLAEKLKKQYM